MPLRLILASSSPQRRRLLKQLRVPFRVIPARIAEDLPESNPRRLVAELALRKAHAVARRHPSAWVLGADTVVVCRGKIIGKPSNRDESARILGELNGRAHRVYTGVALVRGDARIGWREVAVSRVRARRLSKEQLARLIGKHLDKAGGYAVQDREDPFIERVQGDFDNVVGLPLATVRSLLRRAARLRR